MMEKGRAVLVLVQQSDPGESAGLLDELPLSAFQFWSVLISAATVILDGLDNQMLGLAAPSLLKDWGIAREALGYVFALGFVGMAFGTLASGWIGDRYGRRSALLLGVATFGLATLLTGFAHSVVHVAMLKTLAGVGLGGVPGTAAAMIAEFSPKRWRSIAVTFGVVCVSIGGILGGLAAAAILPPLGWRWLFYIGGVATILFSMMLWTFLPESPRYLITRPRRKAELQRMLRRMGHPAPTTVGQPASVSGQDASHAPISELFRGELLRDTCALSVAMLSGMFMIYLMFNWAPTLLSSVGFASSAASLGLTSFNVGGTVGALAASVLIVQFGSRWLLVLMAFVGMLICVALAMLPVAGGHSEGSLLLGLCGLGLFASAAQSAMFAVGAHAFPTMVRARGLGVMGAAGRIGAILSALLGAKLVGGGNLTFFGVLAGLMAVNLVGFLGVRNHVPRLVTATRRQSLAA